MYAVIRTGGKQYRVQQGDLLKAERLDGEVGQKVSFDEVLLLGSDDATQFGTPLVDGAGVSGTIVKQARDRKIVVFKFRRRKDSRSKKGHRQYFTQVRIDAINAPGAEAAEAPEAPEADSDD